jgi:uncharacterized protein YqgC (DUF456 family)
MYQRAKQFTLTRPKVKKTVGGIFVLVGAVALVAPIVPGFPLVFIGLELLGLRMLFLDRFRKQEATLAK